MRKLVVYSAMDLISDDECAELGAYAAEVYGE